MFQQTERRRQRNREEIAHHLELPSNNNKIADKQKLFWQFDFEWNAFCCLCKIANWVRLYVICRVESSRAFNELQYYNWVKKIYNDEKNESFSWLAVHKSYRVDWSGSYTISLLNSFSRSLSLSPLNLPHFEIW